MSIQYLRGIAALGVVLCHYGSNISSLLNFGQTGVFIFFLISGFVIVYSLIKADYKTNQFFIFLLKRSIRIDPLYIVVILLTLILFKILSFLPSFRGNSIPFVAGQFIAHVFYVVPFTKYQFYSHVFWTLCVEFQFYILIGLSYFLSGNATFKSLYLLIFASTCFIPLPKAYYIVFSYAPIFALGISLVTYYKNRYRVHLIAPAFLLVLIAFNFGWLIFILLFLSCIFILYLKLIIKPLAFLGEVSYSLYLTHSLTFIVFTGMAKRINVNLERYLLFWLVVEVSLALVVAYLFYLLIEKPSKRLSKGLSMRNRSYSASPVM